MSTGQGPWFMNRTVTDQFYCRWSKRTVTVRYLTCDGQHPIGMVSCSEQNCDLQCLRADEDGELAPECDESGAPGLGSSATPT
jgi:hypothetical protein